MIARDFQLPPDQPESVYSRQMYKGFRWLRFEPVLEVEFREYLSWNAQMPRKAGLVLALFMWAVFLIADRFLVDPSTHSALSLHLLQVRLGVIGLLVMAIPTVWSANRRKVADHLVPVYLLMINVAVQGCGLMFELYAKPDYISLGIVLGVLALFAPLGQTFWSVMRLVVLSLVVHIGLKVLFKPRLSMSEETLYLFYIVAVVVVCGFIFYLQDHAQRQQFLARRLLGLMAEQDGLTGLTNRRYFMVNAQRGLLQGQRHQAPVALALLDVDDFKAYNDTYGHPAGDFALQQLAGLLKESARRPLDIAARMGGEEFALLLFDCDIAAALPRVEALRADLAALAIEHRRASTGKRLTISIGLAMREPGQPLDDLYRQADQALYQAKASGRDRIQVKTADAPLELVGA